MGLGLDSAKGEIFKEAVFGGYMYGFVREKIAE